MIIEIGYVGYFLLLLGLANCVTLLTPKFLTTHNISSDILISALKYSSQLYLSRLFV